MNNLNDSFVYDENNPSETKAYLANREEAMRLQHLILPLIDFAELHPSDRLVDAIKLLQAEANEIASRNILMLAD